MFGRTRRLVLAACTAVLATSLTLGGPASAQEAKRADVGMQAPGFTLTTDRNEDFSLTSVRGKKHVLLAFYPRAFTPG